MQPTKARMLARTVGVSPDPRVCSPRAAFVTSAILCEKLTRTFWKTCIRPFFLSVELTKNPVVIFCFAEKRLTFTCVRFGFVFRCQGRLPGEAVAVRPSVFHSRR